MDREALRMVCSPEFWRMGVLWTLSLLYSYLLLFLCGLSTTPRCRRPGPHAGGGGGGGGCRICVITGATSGLGKAAAAALAREGYHVVLAGRSAQLLSETAQEIREQQPDAYLEAFQVDLSSYKSIKKFETSLNQWIQDLNLEPSIQILINNAGMLAKSHRVTEDGLDEMMQTNYIGPFILTNILLPLLKNSSVPSRVVNLTSFTHRCVSEIDVSEEALRGGKFGQWSVGRSYPLASTYEYTKFCLLMFSYELHRQLHMSSDVSVMAADPGVVETSIMRELPPCLSWFALFVLRFLNLLQKPHTGVGAVLDAALAPPVTFLLINRKTVLILQQNNVLTSTTNFELYVMFVVFQEASGKYFFGGKRRTIRSSALSYDIDVAKKLWAESSALFQELQLRDYQSRSN